jgi:hypothetical protein
VSEVVDVGAVLDVVDVEVAGAADVVVPGGSDVLGDAVVVVGSGREEPAGLVTGEGGGIVVNDEVAIGGRSGAAGN